MRIKDIFSSLKKSLKKNSKFFIKVKNRYIVFFLILTFGFCSVFLWGILNYKRVAKREEIKKEVFFKKPEKTEIPSIAIILDDAGEDLKLIEDIVLIDCPLTISVLPNYSTSSLCAKKIIDAKKEVILHLPMEPENDKYKRFDGAMILTDMKEDEIKKIFDRDIDIISDAKGFNNHMGSKATQDRNIMTKVLELAKKKGLYFIDSRTSRKSIAFKVAKDIGIKAAENYIFLDVEQDPDKIENRISLLVEYAKKKGKAVGICHITRKETVETLKRVIPKYKGSVRFVFASQVVD